MDHVADDAARVRGSAAFAELADTRARFAALLTTLMLVIYFGFILLVAFAPRLLGIAVSAGGITLGFPLGLGVILAAILLTGVYVLRANRRFDALTTRVVAEAGVGTGR